MNFIPLDATGFIGQGIVFPINLVNGKPPIVTGLPLLNSDLIGIAVWPIGTRMFLGQYGSRIWELIEEPNDVALQSLLRTFLQDAIAQWETRLIFVDMTLEFPDEVTALITYHYKVSDTAPTESFTFPYYRNISS